MQHSLFSEVQKHMSMKNFISSLGIGAIIFGFIVLHIFYKTGLFTDILSGTKEQYYLLGKYCTMLYTALVGLIFLFSILAGQVKKDIPMIINSIKK